MIITINRAPDWALTTLPVGAVTNLPASLADPLIAAGQAVPTPGATVTHSNPFGDSGVASLPFVSSVLSVSAVVKGSAGDPGTFLGLLCTSVSGGKVTIHNAATASNPVPGLGGGGASGLVMTAGSFISLGVAVDCPNGLYIDINGTGSYVVVYQ